MNRFYLQIFATLLIIPVSCTKQDAFTTNPAEKVSMSISLLQDGQTKAADNIQTVIEQSQIIVFDVNGAAEAYGRTSGEESATLNVSIGTKTIWAISNSGQDFSDIRRLSDLEERDILLEENSDELMVMSGSISYVVAKSVNKATVTVSRYLAKVILDKISLDLTSIAMRDKEFVIRSVYLTNCAGSKRVLGTGNTIVRWYNQLGHYDTQMDRMLFCNVNKRLENQSSLDERLYFYILPNPYSNTTLTPTWSLRKSMIVVEATIDGIPCYYPVWIPMVESNQVYEITNFTITKSGSKNPYTPVTGEDGDVSVTGADWGKKNSASFQI